MDSGSKHIDALKLWLVVLAEHLWATVPRSDITALSSPVDGRRMVKLSMERLVLISFMAFRPSAEIH